MKCPVDGEQLIITERNGVEIDYCPKCRGIWLDRGELDKIIERTLGGAAHAPARNHRERRQDYEEQYAPPPPPQHYGHQGYNNSHYGGHHHGSHYNPHGGYKGKHHGHKGYKKPYYKKRKSMLEEIFDVFD